MELVDPIWLVLLIASVFLIILLVYICVVWKEKKQQNQMYVMNSDYPSTLAQNMMPQIPGKQKYLLRDVQYSSINQSGKFSTSSVNIKPNDHFSYNILSIFKNIQNSKSCDLPEDMNKMLPDNLEDSATDAMHKKFDQSVLSLQWNESETKDTNNSKKDNNDTYSCISTDSKTTFTSVVPFFNRTYSVAETFKSTNSGD